MHETIIAGMVLKDLKKHRNLRSASIEVGELAEVTAGELQEALESMCSLRLKVTEKPAVVRCRCGHEGRPEILEREHHFCVFVCRKCGEVPEIVSGNEIMIAEIGVKR